MTGSPHLEFGPRPFWSALLRGMRRRCPRCGHGSLFAAFLKVSPRCPACAEALHHHQADDAPPYFTMLIVGHIVVGLALWAEIRYEPPLWLHAAVWLPAALLLSLALLPGIKGGIVAAQWALRMHGFAGEGDRQD